MKPIVFHTARAFLDTFCTCEECDCDALVDAALLHLRQCGCTRRDLHSFLKAVRRELAKKDAHATVYLMTPTGRSDSEGRVVAAALQKSLGKRLELVEKSDRRLIGGAVLIYDDERMDASLRGALDRLATQLSSS